MSFLYFCQQKSSALNLKTLTCQALQVHIVRAFIKIVFLKRIGVYSLVDIKQCTTNGFVPCMRGEAISCFREQSHNEIHQNSLRFRCADALISGTRWGILKRLKLLPQM